jgi:hypothetical protein
MSIPTRGGAMNRLRPKLTFANVVSCLALFVALGSGAVAASQLGKNSVGTKQLKKNAVTKAKIKKNAVTTAKVSSQAITAAKVKTGTLTGNQIDSATLGTVPTANTAEVANSLTPAEPWHVVGTPGEPAFQNSWVSESKEGQTVAFYKDQVGVVHLRGIAADGTPEKTIFALPLGFRPAPGELLPFAVACLPCEPTATGTLLIAEESPGSVEAPDAEEVSLEGVTFRAES